MFGDMRLLLDKGIHLNGLGAHSVDVNCSEEYGLFIG